MNFNWGPSPIGGFDATFTTIDANEGRSHLFPITPSVLTATPTPVRYLPNNLEILAGVAASMPHAHSLPVSEAMILLSGGNQSQIPSNLSDFNNVQET